MEKIEQMIWQLKDEKFAYNGDLGPVLHEDGSASLTLWSPSADFIQVIIYDKDNQHNDLVRVEMSYQGDGSWRVTLNEENTNGITDLEGYFYHYEISRGKDTVLALDPYAKSLAAWNNEDADSYIAKAAIVNPANYGPELDFPTIKHYEKREDAIIYEVHVRDISSDPSIEENLNHRFGTFEAMKDTLDYIQDLGVTHIQLLPVLAYYNANELDTHYHYLEYKSAYSNYNWGYDPMHYFALTGMYSINPEDPKSRIAEFKELVREIHSRGMGVTLDVVYNHTAALHILEDLEPEYYHFMDADKTSRENFGGGRLGSTHYMTRRLIIDSLKYLVEEYKVDGFRFDMMGDLDAETIQMAYDELVEINPNILMIGEGWVTYVGDELDPNVVAADQNWMQYTEAVGSFSDDFRDELKSGYPSEGSPRFLTAGRRRIETLFSNIIAKPTNFVADQPGDVVQYIEAHDNLTLHDVIAYSIKKDPKYFSDEIHRRIRLGNLVLLTSQGTTFIHAGQEYGRTKQYRHPDFINPVTERHLIPDNSTFMVDFHNQPFEYPYFIHDSYNSSDAVNMFEWQKVSDEEKYPIENHTLEFTKGLVKLRRSNSSFHLGSYEEIFKKVKLLDLAEVREHDLIIAYQVSNEIYDYIVLINADTAARKFSVSLLDQDYAFLVDSEKAGVEPIEQPEGVRIFEDYLILKELSAAVIRISKK